MNQQNTKREEFISVINTLKGLSSTITDEQRKGLLQQAVQQLGFSVDEAKDILIESGLAVNEMINFFEVLELSIEELQNQSDEQINTLVDEVHNRLYSTSLRAGGLPRPDGRTQEQWRTVLNQARETLANPQERLKHIAKIQNENLHYVDSTVNVDIISPKQDENPVDDPTALRVSIPEDMVLIPAGEFQMGNGSEKASDREKPAHTVYVDAFYMDKYPVTNQQFQMFLEANPLWCKSYKWQWLDPAKWHEWHKENPLSINRKFHDGDYLKKWKWNYYEQGTGDFPVTHVSWYAAMAYAEWVGKRLPTEAEWEKAARGGLTGQKYPWGNTLDSNKVHSGRDLSITNSVGKYPANNYGLYDMVGNVWEWCLDEYLHNYYASSPLQNPVAGADMKEDFQFLINNYRLINTDRVLRGGTMFTSSKPSQTTTRWGGVPFITSIRASYSTKFLDSLSFSVIANIGFRCVKNIDIKSESD